MFKKKSFYDTSSKRKLNNKMEIKITFEGKNYNKKTTNTP